MVNKAGNSNWYYEVKDGTAYQTNSNTAITVNQWHTLTVVQKGTTSTFYIDGEQKGTATISLKPGSIGYAFCDNWLGRSPFTGDAYMTNTYMDNLRIYNTAITAAEVKGLADSRPTSIKKGDPTGIKDAVHCENLKVNSFYDLQGRCVEGVPKKGLYIIGGKKVFVK